MMLINMINIIVLMINITADLRYTIICTLNTFYSIKARTGASVHKKTSV